MFKPLDTIFYLLILAIMIFPFVRQASINSPLNSAIVITIDKQFRKTLDASRDSLYTIAYGKVHFKLEIKNGKVRIKESACSNKHCLRMGWLGPENRGSIICIPQKTIISFEETEDQKENNEIDAITG